MKKFLSVFITAALILTVSACGNNTTDNTTGNDNTTSATEEVKETTKKTENTEKSVETEETVNTETSESTEAPETEVTTSVPGTEAETSAPETEPPESAEVSESTEATKNTEITEATNPPRGEPDGNETLDKLKDKAPLYYEFGKIATAVPVTIIMTLIDTDGSEMGTMKNSMASLDSFAIRVERDGQSYRMIQDKGVYYIVNDVGKSAMYYSVPEDEGSAMDELGSSMQVYFTFDFDKVEFTSGTEEFMGETLKYETVDDGTTAATLYFAPSTDRVKYMVSEGQTVRIDDYYTGIDKSLFEIPEGYQMLDFASLTSGLTADE